MAIAEKDAASSAEESFLETVRKRYTLCVDADRDNRDRAREALRFRDLEQWDADTKNERLNDAEGSRPCLVVDKLNQHVNQVVNDERMNRPQIKVRPVDGGADIEVAKIYDGIIRHIQDRSHADIAYDTGFECAVDGGFGFWRVITEFCDPMSFEQEIKIGRIRNRFAVYLDPQHQEPDGSDAQYGFILYKCTKDEFKREFGESGETALGAFNYEGREFTDWYGEDWVIYAEYFWIEKKRETICLLSNGKVVRKGDYTDEDLAAQGLSVAVRDGGERIERETMLKLVRWRKVTATKILEEGEWAGQWIPIVEVIGTELDIEGRVRRSGMIRPAMDAQRVDNYATSAFVENVALAPRASWVAAVGQLEGQEETWRTANRRNISTLQYRPISVDGVVVTPPQRSQPPGISQGWLSVMEQSEHNVQAAMGRYNATLGAPSNETSGRAINARSREGDIGSFHYSDNLARSLRHTGRILVDLIPKIMDTRRIARIIGMDGTPDSAVIDPELADEMGNPIPYAERQNAEGKMEKVFNLGVGKYDVTIVTGPSFTTRRLESADAMMEISRGNPEFLNRFGDIIFKSQDWPGSEEIAERFQKMLPPELQNKEDSDNPSADLARKAGQVQAAVQALGQKEAELNALQAQLQDSMQANAEQEAKAKEAIARAQSKVDEINAQQEYIKAQHEVLASERRELVLARQLADAQIQNAALKATGQIQEEAVAAERETMEKREAEVTSKTVLTESTIAALAEGQAQIAQAVIEMTRALGAERESELIEDPATGAMRARSRVILPESTMQ